MLILGGLFSIPVYLLFYFEVKKEPIQIQLSKKVNFKKNNSFLPYLLFALLSTTITYHDISNSILFLIRSLYIMVILNEYTRYNIQ